MRALVVTAILATNAAFVPGDLVVTGEAPRATRVLEAGVDGGWRVQRDRDTGVVARMWGGAVIVPGAGGDAAIAERGARAFLEAQLARLAPGARVADFVLAANRLDGRLRTIAFHQTAAGLRVVGGRVHVVFAGDRLIAAGSDALPDVRVAIPSAKRAPTRAAEAWLRGALGPRAPLTVRATGERVILPRVRAGAIEYRVAEVLDATAGHGRWDVYVGQDGAPLLRVPRVASATATLRYDVPVRHPGATRALLAAPRASLLVDATATETDDTGLFAWAGGAAAAAEPTATGALVRVLPFAGAPVAASLVAQPGGFVDWSLAADEFADAQLAAYVHAMVAKARARRMHPTLAWLDQPLEVHVNEPDSCNALSTGDSIHFFRANAECENTARLADVVLHEFAHSLHTQSIIPGAGEFDQAMSEGLSDFFAANLTGDPAVGRGFRYDDAPVRDIDPAVELVYPRDVTGIPHTTGLILAGALWDLRTALVAELGADAGIAAVERVYVGILQRASDLPTAYAAALLADDDDGDLGNGTPHQCALEAAFARHGLVPDFETTTLAPPVVTGRAVSVAVTTPVTACPRPSVTRATLAWQPPGGVEQELAMTLDGAALTAELPAQPADTTIRFRVTAELSDGSIVRFPDNPADPAYQLFLGTATPIFCASMDTDPRWAQAGFEWAPPFGRAEDAPVPFTGVGVLGTNLLGDGRYAAGATATLETPPIDASGFERVRIQFRRWLAIDAAGNDRATVSANGTELWRNADELVHVDREWRFVDLEVAPRADLVVQWALTANADDVTLGGWNLDDVCVVGLGKLPRCGDGVVDPGEACDGEDDCAADCTIVEAGGCCSGSGGAGSLGLGLGVLALLARRPRRRSHGAPQPS